MKSLIRYIFFISFSFSFAQNISFELYFDSGAFVLQKKHKKDIDAKLIYLDSTKQYNVNIHGYTDYVDTEDFNQDLSKKRATAAASYILKHYENYINKLDKKAHGELTSDEKSHPRGFRKHRKVTIEITTVPKQKSTKIKDLYNLDIDNLVVGQDYVIDEINFRVGRTSLTYKSKNAIRKLLRFLKKNRRLHIEIQGHVCCGKTIEDALNEDTQRNTLSRDRAEFVFKYLVKNGISSKRLRFRGYGFSNPLIYPENTEDDRAQNRRVAIKILKK